MKAELESLVDQMITGGILFEEAVNEFEKKFILNVVSRNNHNLSKAADELGIHRNTLSKRVGEYENGVNGNGRHLNGHGKSQSKGAGKGQNSGLKRKAVPRRKKPLSN